MQHRTFGNDHEYWVGGRSYVCPGGLVLPCFKLLPRKPSVRTAMSRFKSGIIPLEFKSIACRQFHTASLSHLSLPLLFPALKLNSKVCLLNRVLLSHASPNKTTWKLLTPNEFLRMKILITFILFNRATFYAHQIFKRQMILLSNLFTYSRYKIARRHIIGLGINLKRM